MQKDRKFQILESTAWANLTDDDVVKFYELEKSIVREYGTLEGKHNLLADLIRNALDCPEFLREFK